MNNLRHKVLSVIFFILLFFSSAHADFDIKANYIKLTQDLERIRNLKFTKQVPC